MNILGRSMSAQKRGKSQILRHASSLGVLFSFRFFLFASQICRSPFQPQIHGLFCGDGVGVSGIIVCM